MGVGCLTCLILFWLYLASINLVGTLQLTAYVALAWAMGWGLVWIRRGAIAAAHYVMTAPERARVKRRQEDHDHQCEEREAEDARQKQRDLQQRMDMAKLNHELELERIKNQPKPLTQAEIAAQKAAAYRVAIEAVDRRTDIDEEEKRALKFQIDELYLDETKKTLR